jgi:hypothetical protein
MIIQETVLEAHTNIHETDLEVPMIIHKSILVVLHPRTMDAMILQEEDTPKVI